MDAELTVPLATFHADPGAEIATLRAALLLAQATLAAQVEATHTETTRLRGLLNDAHNTNHAERIELAALRARLTALEEGLRDVLWWSINVTGHGAEDHRCAVCDCRAPSLDQMVHAENCIIADVGALLAPPTPEPTGGTT